ncbi:fused MFS/spermidine synthase [Nocardioides sp. BP30]|uniref:spermidine synthase n=1 Tax=Nocardioides sp. BP30 TaxID=3036374 RepID=UPI0024687528|nr:fused MFS/spermidine synthase [Nocardioides sp. BP30]WGL50574.1 fused MFS/spermidine synthase [Nocardioides sp. BP30]
MNASMEIVPADRSDAFLLRMDGMDQSYVDLADPSRLVFDYVRRIGDVIDAHSLSGDPLRVLHVGGAGLTLPRYVAATRPRSAQVVLEPDADLVDRVRAELPLPVRSGIKVRIVDGRSGLAAVRDGSQDLVVVDAFAEGRMPADLTTATFFAEVRRVLAQDGRLVANLGDAAPFPHARRVIAGIRQSLPELVVTAEAATLRGRRQGNLVVVAGHLGGAEIAVALEAAAARAGAPYRVLDGRAVSDTLGGGVPFVDADAESGPAPVSGR